MKQQQQLRSSLLLRFKSINAQLTFSFSVLIIVVIGCIIFVVAVLFSSRFSQQNNEIMYNSVEIVCDSIESRINIIRKLIPVIRNDDEISTALVNKEYSLAASARLSTLYAYGLQSAFITTTDQQVLDQAYLGSESSSRMLMVTGFYDFISSGREEMFSSPHGFPFLNLPQDNRYNSRISYFHTLRDASNYNVYGHAILVITAESLFADRMDMIESLFDNFYVIDGSKNVIYSMSGEYSSNEVMDYARNSFIDENSPSHAVHSDNTYFHAIINSYPDWHIVGVVSISALTENTKLIIVFVVLIGIMGILLVIFLSSVISKRISQPIQVLNRSMVKFSAGVIPEKVELSITGEMGTLVNGFNNMLDNIRTNLDAIFTEQEKKKNAEVSALQYRLQSLQNQINPHFLYNTLNIVSYLALDGKCEEIRSLNQSLSQLLRSTLSNTQENVTINHELTFLAAYVHIMEYRYPNMFEVCIHADEQIKDALIPKLILQPLVENAMLHGIFPTGNAGVIDVKITQEDKNLHISITDNGIGMDEDQLSGLFLARSGFNSIGLNNVNDRLKLCYGPDSVLYITSHKGCGTTVEFSIPISRDE